MSLQPPRCRDTEKKKGTIFSVSQCLCGLRPSPCLVPLWFIVTQHHSVISLQPPRCRDTEKKKGTIFSVSQCLCGLRPSPCLRASVVYRHAASAAPAELTSPNSHVGHERQMIGGHHRQPRARQLDADDF